MATHSSILAWDIPWTEEPDNLQPMGSEESDTTQRLNNNNRKIPGSNNILEGPQIPLEKVLVLKFKHTHSWLLLGPQSGGSHVVPRVDHSPIALCSVSSPPTTSVALARGRG